MAKPDHITIDIHEDDLIPPAPTYHHASKYDSDFFHQVVKDAGRWAFGVIFVEVWVLNSEKTYLLRPERGWWLDIYANDCGQNSKFDRLIDSTRSDYLEPAPLAPGVGLPGALWSELQSGNAATGMKTKSKPSGGGQKPLEMSWHSDGGYGSIRSVAHSTHSAVSSSGSDMLMQTVTWREVGPLANDPDQPHNPRLQFLAQCGLGLAAGVPFKVGDNEGLVVYMARETADPSKLTDKINVDYLAHASLLIGSAYALRGPRIAAENARKVEMHNTMGRVKLKLKTLKRLKRNLGSFVLEQHSHDSAKEEVHHGGMHGMSKTKSATCSASTVQSMSRKLRTMFKKMWGANVKAPPLMTWDQTVVTFCGSLLTLLLLTRMNKALVDNFGSEYTIILGPFGALMTLQYGLTAAPASQPRNATVGTSLALIIAQVIGQSLNMELWVKQSLATALAIAAMVKFGVTHPPAGAAALLFSSGTRTWQQLGIMIAASVVAICSATLINNLSDKRQYPTFWGFREINDILYGNDQVTWYKRKERKMTTCKP